MRIARAALMAGAMAAATLAIATPAHAATGSGCSSPNGNGFTVCIDDLTYNGSVTTMKLSFHAVHKTDYRVSVSSFGYSKLFWDGGTDLVRKTGKWSARACASEATYGTVCTSTVSPNIL